MHRVESVATERVACLALQTEGKALLRCLLRSPGACVLRGEGGGSPEAARWQRSSVGNGAAGRGGFLGGDTSPSLYCFNGYTAV